MRRLPYTKAGIKRVPCLRCGNTSASQWQICSDLNQWRGVCNECDIALNRLVLNFFRVPGRAAKLHAYVAARAVALGIRPEGK